MSFHVNQNILYMQHTAIWLQPSHHKNEYIGFNEILNSICAIHFSPLLKGVTKRVIKLKFQ